MNNRVLLIDGNSLYFRSFYATARKNFDDTWDVLRNSKGLATNAVNTFAKMFTNLIDQIQPDYVLVAFDFHGPTFRHENDFYKSTRKEQPKDLHDQKKFIQEFIESMGIKQMEVEGIEADDIIGIISRLFSQNYKISIVTGDRDLYQLATNNIDIWYPQGANKGYLVVNEEVFANKYGNLKPIQLIDVKALMGDASDNIKGVSGIGEKGAIKLISEYGSIENIYENIDEIKGAVKDKLIADKDSAFLSKKIATILVQEKAPEAKNLYIENIEDFKVNSVDKERLENLLNYLELNSLKTRLL